MELDVLGVDDASASPIGHGQAIAAGALGVGGVAVDAPQAAGGQQGGPGQDAVDLFLGLVEGVGAVAGDRPVDGQWVGGVVGRGDEVHGRQAGAQGDVGQLAQAGEQSLLDGPAGGVADVQDARQRVAALAGVGQLAGVVAVERDAGLVDQHALDQVRPLLGQQAHGRRQAQPGAGGQDVAGQQLRRIAGAPPDDAALGIVGVALLGPGGAGDDQDLALAVLGQAQGSGRAGDAGADDQDVSFNGIGLPLTPALSPMGEGFRGQAFAGGPGGHGGWFRDRRLFRWRSRHGPGPPAPGPGSTT